MTRCKNQPVNFKDIIGSFAPFLIAILAQYVLNILDVVILFFHNALSDTKSNSEYTISKLLQMDYNQPMNQAYLVLAQHVTFLLCFGIWYYRIFFKEKMSAGECFSPKQTLLMKKTILLFIAGVTLQVLVDGILTLVSPYFPSLFASYYELVEKAVGIQSTIPMILATFLVAPIGEELFFRGVIFGYARRYMHPLLAILFQGLLFGIYHGNLIQGIYACVLGCVLGYVAYKSDSILPGMVLHFSINLSVLFVPSVWFTQTIRCIVISVIAGILSVLCIVFATHFHSKKSSKTKSEG